MEWKFLEELHFGETEIDFFGKFLVSSRLAPELRNCLLGEGEETGFLEKCVAYVPARYAAWRAGQLGTHQMGIPQSWTVHFSLRR